MQSKYKLVSGGQLSRGKNFMLFKFILTIKLSIFIVKNRYTLTLLFKHLQVQITIRGGLSGGEKYLILSNTLLEVFASYVYIWNLDL